MEAGAKLQEEAALAGQREANVSMVTTGKIRQETNVEVPNIPASELHVLKTNIAAECRPVIQQQVCSERIRTTEQKQTEKQQTRLVS